MSELIQLNKFELISKIQSIKRENNRLKTLLIRHQLLTNFYQQLYENCVQLNNFQLNQNNIQIKCDLKLKQIKLLSQIEAISECNKSVSVTLPQLRPKNWTLNQLFMVEKSTQCELKEDLPQIEKQEFNEVFSEILCQSMTISSVKNESQIDINLNNESNDIIEHKIEKTNDIKVISIDLNNETSSDAIISPSVKSSTKKVSKEIIKLFSCNYCLKKYKHKKSLDKHLNQIHGYISNEVKPEVSEQIDKNDLKSSPKNNYMTCQWPDCKLKFKNRTLFLRHYSIHNESRKLCSDCGLKFQDLNRMREHMIWHSIHSNHSNQTIGSDIPQVNNNSYQYSNAVIETNDNSVSNNFDNNFDNKIDLKINLKQNSTERKLICDFQNCNYKTSNSLNLEIHQKRAHEKVYTLL